MLSMANLDYRLYLTLFLPVCQVYNCGCKIFLRKGLEVKIFIKKDLAWQFWLGYSPSSQTCVNELNNLMTRLCRCCGDGFCFQRAPGQVMRRALSAGPLGTRAQPTSLARSSSLSSYERTCRDKAHADGWPKSPPKNVSLGAAPSEG